MIENDEQYNKIFKEYLNSKGIDTKNQEYYSCEDLGCDNCILNNVNRDREFCARYPFKEIKRHEKQISLLKQDISIMEKWKKENGKVVLYHNLLDNLDAIKATYTDISNEIKELLDKASSQAQMELRKEEKKK